MSTELEELYQAVILDHSRRPRNFGELPDASVVVHGDNPSCGDEIHLAMRFADDGALEEVKFTGQGCAISQAAASLMTLKLKGRQRDDAQQLLTAFQQLVTTTDEPPNAASLGDLRLLAGVRKFPQRVKCAMLACRAAEQALQLGSGGGKVNTEAEFSIS
jgi:nitrogen fixation protein NifU and related proteins